MNNKEKSKISAQNARKIARVRSKVRGSATRPRLAVRRTLTSFSAQLINDDKGVTITAVNQKELKKKVSRMDASQALGKLLAEKATKAGIKQVVFDRRNYKYHGRVKAFADAAREAGLQF